MTGDNVEGRHAPLVALRQPLVWSILFLLVGRAKAIPLLKLAAPSPSVGSEPLAHLSTFSYLCWEKVMKVNVLNRTALTVIPKQPYINWANALDDDGPKLDINDPHSEPTVYLTDEVADNAVLTRTLRRHYAQIFEYELSNWHLVKTDWPRKRDFRTFQDWFDVRVSTIVLDLSKRSIKLERFQVRSL